MTVDRSLFTRKMANLVMMNLSRFFKAVTFPFGVGIILLLPHSIYGQQRPLKFKTHTGNIISVSGGVISYNGKAVKRFDDADDILDASELNRLLEDHGSVFLFLAIDGRPNLDTYTVFKITSSDATIVANAMLSPVKDYDHDGYLEFGGRDLTEGYSNPDSMYYIPTEYFKIKDGKIYKDEKLTRQKDIEINGIYLPPGKRLDQNGTCCVVIPDPKHRGKKTIVNNSPYLEKSYLPSDTYTVSATSYVLSGQDAITEAVHNTDGSWEFFSDNRTYTPKTALRKVKLGVLVKLDATILKLSWIPKGYFANRQNKEAPWIWDKLKGKN